MSKQNSFFVSFCFLSLLVCFGSTLPASEKEKAKENDLKLLNVNITDILSNSTGIQKSVQTCIFDYECPAFSVCYSGFCRCNQGYNRTVRQPNVCTRIQCSWDSQCWNSDVNSHCSNGYCYCDGSLDSLSQRCNAKTRCITSTDCPLNSYCLGDTCICNQGYKKTDKYSKTCTLISCAFDSECWDNDINSHCSNGRCVCDGTLNYILQTCNAKVIYYHSYTSYGWVALAPGAIVGGIYGCSKHRTRRVAVVRATPTVK